MRLRRRAALAAAALAAVTLPAACSGVPGLRAGLPGAPSGPRVRAFEAGHRGGTLRVMAQSAAGPIDPQLNYTPQFWQIFPAVYDGLMAFAQVDGADSTRVVPDLAASAPAVSDGGRRYVFTLRRGVRFSSGAPVTVDDVVASLRRLFAVGAPTAATTYSGIVGADACLAAPAACTLAGGVSADPAAGTVTVNLVRPDPDLPAKLALPPASVLPAGTPTVDAGATAPPGTGAYRITSYDPSTALVLDRNPHFTEWNRLAQPQGYPDRITQEFAHPPDAALTAVRAGQADLLADDPPPRPLVGASGRAAQVASTQVPSTQSRQGQVHVHPLAASWYLAMNVGVAPFDRPQARQAVNWAVDRAAAVRAYGGSGLATPACTVLPPGIPGHREECAYTAGAGPTWTAPDVQRARALVAASGTAGQRVRLVVADDPVSTAIGADVAASLRAAGFAATVRSLPADVLYRYVTDPTNQAQITLATWFQDYPSAAAAVEGLLGCPSPPAGRSLVALAGPCSGPVRARVDTAVRSGASSAWGDVDREAMLAAPIAPLLTPRHVDVVSQRVGNYQWSDQYRAILSQLWVR